MRGRSWGIGGKFILFISISIVLFLATAYLISQRVFRDFALRSADEAAQTILDQTDKRLEQFFRDMQFVARSLAGTKSVREVDPAGMRDLFMATVRARDTHLRAIYLGTQDGRMFEWGVGAGFVDDVPSFPPGYDPRRRPWYQLAVSVGDFAVSEPYVYASVNALGITCVLPLRGADGSVSGVLGLDILLDDLASILQGLQIPRGGKALILSRAGDIVASQFPEGRAERLELKRFDLAGGESVLSGEPGSFIGEVGGTETLFAYKAAKGLDWIIAVGMPLRAVMEPVSEILNVVSAIDLFLMILFVIALTSITTRLLVSPLNQMAAVVRRIKSGEEEARVEVRSGDEFGLLGDELNRLLDTVAENARDLEDKVRQRGEELARLQRENTQLRVLEERQRIYRDLHDTIGAKLTNVFFCNGVGRDLARELRRASREASPEAVEPAPSESWKDLAAMQDRIEANCLQAISRLKEIVLGMRADDRLAADFAKLVTAGLRQRLGDRGIALDCRVRGKEAINAIGPEARSEIEKIFDELVSNVLKHSGASRVRLRLSMGAAALSVDFSDDGRGFSAPPPALPGGSGQSSPVSGQSSPVSGQSSPVSGLGNIAYRVERLGGSLAVVSEPGSGSRFSFTLPAASLGSPRREAEDTGGAA